MPRPPTPRCMRRFPLWTQQFRDLRYREWCRGSNLGLQPAYAGNLKILAAVRWLLQTRARRVRIELTLSPPSNGACPSMPRGSMPPSTRSVRRSMPGSPASAILGTVNNPPGGLDQTLGWQHVCVQLERQYSFRYNLLKAQIGHVAPELSPYMANFITNYSFDKGFLKGSMRGCLSLARPANLGGQSSGDQASMVTRFAGLPAIGQPALTPSRNPYQSCSGDEVRHVRGEFRCHVANLRFQQVVAERIWRSSCTQTCCHPKV